MEGKAEQPRFARRYVRSSAKTAIVLLGIGLAGSVVTLFVHRLDPSDTILADAVILPSATAQVGADDGTRSPLAAQAQAR